ncbi:MAG: ribosomal protein S18-alanine N-acetyltransferase [Saccharofermentans sp.]|nr:ribosomal protein S18-alanine N-acetyltransferase [Saccharofermentans sp.]
MPDDKLIIRSGEPDDIREIMKLEEGSIAHPWESEEIAKLITEERKKCYVACCEDQVVCYVGAETVLDECNIGNIVTAKEFRGRGFATELLDYLLNDLKCDGIAKVFLEVEHDNAPALTLYEKAGFVKYGHRRDYYGKGRDAVLMSKDLC